jgi:hypothetical protein
MKGRKEKKTKKKKLEKGQAMHERAWRPVLDPGFA